MDSLVVDLSAGSAGGDSLVVIPKSSNLSLTTCQEECLKPPAHIMMERNREGELEKTMIQAAGAGASQTQGFRTGRLGQSKSDC